MLKQANNAQSVLRLSCSHGHFSSGYAEFANNVDAEESADNEFSSASREFVLKS